MVAAVRIPHPDPQSPAAFRVSERYAAGTDELTPESQEHSAPRLRRSRESLHPERYVQGKILGFGAGVRCDRPGVLGSGFRSSKCPSRFKAQFKNDKTGTDIGIGREEPAGAFSHLCSVPATFPQNGAGSLTGDGLPAPSGRGPPSTRRAQKPGNVTRGQRASALGPPSLHPLVGRRHRGGVTLLHDLGQRLGDHKGFPGGCWVVYVQASGTESELRRPS